MKKLTLAIIGLTALLLSIPARAQTVTFSNTTINSNVAHGSWINVGTPNASDSGQMLKNLIGVWNWNSEPIIDRQQYTAQAAGTSTTVATSDGAAPTSYWVGGTIQILNSVNTGAEVGCSSTITANTASTITFSPACGAAIKAGDNIYLTRTVSPTSETDWESGFNRNAGVAGIVSGGGKITSATTGLCSDCGAQSVVLNATSGSSELQYYWDGNYTQNIYVLMNGNYQLRFNAYSLAGSTTALTFACSRSGGFSFSYTPTLTTSPAYYTDNFTASETQGSTAPNEVICTASVSGGSVQFDNVSIERVETGTNTTVYRDEFVQHLIQRRPAGLRFWNYTSQNGETAANWTNPDTSHACTTAGNAYYSQGCEPSLDDYLKLVQYLSTQLGYTVGMDVEVPIGFTSTEYTNFEDYIVATSGTWATKRAANGQSSPYIPNVLPLIHAAPCNECWNGATPGQQLGYYPGSSTGTFGTYGAALNYAFSAFRGDANYVSSQWDLVANAQTGQGGGDAVVYMAQANPPDSIELNGYGISQVNESTDAMWNGVLAWPNNITSSGDLTGLHSAVATVQGTSTCGASKSATCKVNVYEWNVGFSGSNQGSISQTYMDYLTAGAGAGIEYALQQLLMNQTNNIGLNAYFAAEGYNIGSSPDPSVWGDTVDDGGATNLLRPQALALEVYNTAAVGGMTSCPITSGPTYNFAGDSNITFGGPGMPAQSGIPTVYAGCFANGSTRGVVFINVDQSSSHALAFAGANAPTGTVSTLAYSPSTLDLLNQTPTASLPTNHATANVVLTSGSASSPTSITIPKQSIVAYTWTVGASVCSTPTFSPVAGTYSSTQTVAISTTTLSPTIYYTTDGTTPTTGSAVYTAPLTVSTTQTVQAICAAAGLSLSGVGSALYTIETQAATPTFSPATGSYSSTQTVTISDSTPSSTIYYTTDGSTPTTGSTVYSSPISVAVTTTVKAIATASGFTQSNVGSAAYTITTQAAAPTFSPAPGTYATTQTVTLSDSTPSSTIYYTIDGSTPTTGSTVYSTALSVSSTTTVKAIATASGFTQSNVASGTYTIGPQVQSGFTGNVVFTGNVTIQ